MQAAKDKYRPFPKVPLKERRWPGNTVEKAPAWCSVDLRDGNQALVNPMGLQQKLDFFRTLCQVGFREIEVGFPAASQVEFDCCRQLIERGLIPEGVAIQVIMQAKEPQIRRSFEAVRGAKEAIIHLYNSTSTVQRQVVFQKDMQGIVDIAVQGAQLIRRLAQEDDSGTKYRFEYSPESFSGTEVENAVWIIDEVMEALGAGPDNRVIVDLTNTVELATPNVFADQVEYVSTHMKHRDWAILSVHPHNDRGTGLASAELALLAGAERVEGALFGNGERTGNIDLVTMALNLYTQGIDPGLDFSDLPHLRALYELYTGMRVPKRQPYAGELVFTAFSGSHQDAIRKGVEYMKQNQGACGWMVPYLPIDPADIGRQYDPIIRINSQSGKGGAAFVMQAAFGYTLPKAMHAEFGALVKKACDKKGEELSNEELFQVFRENYLDFPGHYSLSGSSIFHESGERGSAVQFRGAIRVGEKRVPVEGSGNGPIDAFFNALKRIGIDRYRFVSYHEHAISAGSDANAIAYIELRTPKHNTVFGVGIESNINMASIKGVLCAINRAELLGL